MRLRVPCLCDGSQFKSHPLCKNDKNALQIVAYYNELEVCNPLGAAAKVHKLGLVFMFLANIKPIAYDSIGCSCHIKSY